MEYTVKNLAKSEVEIKITVSAEDMDTYRKKACEDISKDVKIKGFRSGHIPLHVLENHVDKKLIEAHTQEVAIQRAYVDAVKKEKIQVVSRPKIKVDEQEPFSFTATVAIMPEVEVKDHQSIKIKKEEIKVTEKDIKEVMGNMKKHGTTYKESDGAAKKGDKVEVDFEGFDEDGKSVPNTKSAGHPLIIGENTLIPGFEEELIGLKKDEKKEFKLTFPKDYHKEDFQNKKMTFKVEIKKIEEPVEPEINEEYIEKMTGKKLTMEEFTKDIEKNILAKKEEEAKQKNETDYLEALLKKTKAELPEALIEEEVSFIVEEMKKDIAKRGLEFEQFLTQAKTTIEDLRKKYRPEAEKRIKTRLALRKVIAEENIKVEDKELQEEFEKIKSFYPETEHEKITKDFEGGELKIQLINRLSLRKFFAKVL